MKNNYWYDLFKQNYFPFFSFRSTFFILSLPFTVRFRSTELFELKKNGKRNKITKNKFSYQMWLGMTLRWGSLGSYRRLGRLGCLEVSDTCPLIAMRRNSIIALLFREMQKGGKSAGPLQKTSGDWVEAKK